MDIIIIAAIALAVVGFALISARLETGIVTPPMAFTALGFVLAVGVVEVGPTLVESPAVHLLAECTLVLVLFTDASRIDVAQLRREHNVPVRMLAVGMPLTIVAGTGAAVGLLDGISLAAAAVLATMLAPTDAALGQAVVSNERVPVRLRQALNVESGLNDGIALPVLLVLVSIAGSVGHAKSGTELATFAALQVTVGPLVGLAIGYIGAKLMERSYGAGWISGPFLRLGALGLAVLCFAGAELAHGNGFIAAFVGGLTFGNCARKICPTVHAFADAEGQLLTLATFMVFGAAMLPPALEAMTPIMVVYAVLSLTVVRVVPVALSLMGTGLRWESVAFVGWFGPRGIASVLFALVVLEEANFAGKETVLTVTVIAVLLSIVAHGATAAPMARLFSRRLADMTPEACQAEMKAVSEMPVRLSTGRLQSTA